MKRPGFGVQSLLNFSILASGIANRKADFSLPGRGECGSEAARR